ncbi:collagen alpha-2(I) chain [Dermacentor silvarum]|uniref:collagen alpha-2(I) chain n=1 Tax=Dermacentor silvarum TaxID=543639 RepID=UPI00189C1A13|nr:collagen alpha-2(I) chain [Dermacentor silvarum]
MKFLLLLFAAGAATADLTHLGHSPDGSQQYRTQGPGGYSFGYSHAHGAGGGASWRKESADAAGNVIGSYGLKDVDGRVRLVTYVANQDGFQANVQSNEPGLPQQHPGLGAGITQWPIPQGHVQGHHPGAHPGAIGTASNQGSWASGGGPQVASGHADASGAYDFEYGQGIGPFQKESGDATGNKKGVYGLNDLDGRMRTVNYVADDGGFRATVVSNEPGVDDVQDPADVDVTKRPEPAGIALVHLGPPGSAHSGAALVPPTSIGAGAPAIPVAPAGSAFPAPPGSVGPVDTGFGQQDGSGAYNFAYGNDQIEGPWQKESGDAVGNKAGSYGLRINDGRFRTVNYVAGAQGFRASVDTNEPGVDGAQSPADAIVNKSPESAGIVPIGAGGLPGVQGQVVIPAAPVGPAMIGPPGVSLVPWSAGFPGVQGQVPVGSVGPAMSGLPAVSWVPGTAGFPAIHGSPTGPGAPGLNGPVPTGNVVFTSPSLGPAGGYSFGYSGGPGGAFHSEAGDASGLKKGVYGFSGEGGAVRTVNYVADNTGFRASVQSNEPGVDTSQNPADVSLRPHGGVVAIPSAS